MTRRVLALLALAAALAACGHYGAPVHAQRAHDEATEATPPAASDATPPTDAPERDRHEP